MIHWHDGPWRCHVVATLGGEVYHAPRHARYYESVAMGTQLYVWILRYDSMDTVINIPLGHDYAGAPSIVHGYTIGSGNSLASVFFITFIEYDYDYSDPEDFAVGMEVRIVSVTVPRTGPVSMSSLTSRLCTINAHNPSTAVYLAPEGPAGHLYLHTVWQDVGSISYWVNSIPSPSIPPGEVEEIGYEYAFVLGVSPHISSYGDRIFLVYRDYDDLWDTEGFILRSTRDANQSGNDHLDQGWIEEGRNLSEVTPGYDLCNWPQGGSNVVAWTQQVWNAHIQLIRWDPDSSEPSWMLGIAAHAVDSFPNIVTYNLWQGGEIEHTVDMAHVGGPSPWEVWFDHIEFSSISSLSSLSHISIAPGVPVYYHIKCGDSIPSYYCEKRDGYATLNGHSVDVGSRELIYKLPLLNPSYHYLVRATVFTPQFFPDSSNSVSESFDFDGEKVSLSATSAKPETLGFIIPQNLCKEDREVRLRITGEKGAWLEDIKVYQFEVWGQNPPQTQTSRGIASSKSNRLPLSITITPNIFSSATTIKYQVTNKGRVSLGVYDATGKLVKTLNRARSLKPGIYSVIWNGRDKTGRMLPSGIYFIRLETEGSALIKKVMLLR